VKPISPHVEAEEEFNAQVDYYEDQEEGLGERFRSAVEESIERIRTQPNFFPHWEDTVFRECPVKRFPFAVYYVERPTYIWVVAIADQRRRPGYWLIRVRRR
jgi:hypothetical protein